MRDANPNVVLNAEDYDAIYRMSDELEIDLAESGRYWIQAKKKSDTVKLGKLIGKNLGNDYDMIAREFYMLDCQGLLDSVYYLFRARSDHYLNDLKKRSVMVITNRLLTMTPNPIAENLMNIMQNFAKLINPLNEDIPSEKRRLVEGFIGDIAKCLFFIFYETQILPSEAVALLECIKSISSESFGHFSVSRDSWPNPVISSLIILELTQVRALNLRVAPSDALPFFDRGFNHPPYGKDDDQPAGAMAGHDLTSDLVKTWKARLVRGFSCLAYAGFLQVRMEYMEGRARDKAFSNMCTLLKEASVTRAFSYIRTCMIPFLQTSFERPADQELKRYLIEVLADFIFLMVMAIDGNEEAKFIHENDDNMPSFLLSRSGLQEQYDFERNQAHDERACPLGMHDCFDDIVEMVGAMGVGNTT